MNTFAHLLQPPAFADEEKTRRAYILHVLLLYMQLSFVIGGGIGVAFVFSQKTVPTLALLLGVIVMAVAFHLNQRGQVKSASVILISVLWLIVTGCILVSHGTRSPIMIFYASGTVTTGLLLGAWGAYIYTLVTILAGLVIAALSSIGIIVIPDVFTIAPFSGWLVLAINLILTVIPLNIALNTLSTALAKARAELLERKQIEDRLRLSEERYRLVNATISDYTFSAVRDADGKLHQNWVAGAFEQITGYTMEEFIRQGGWEAILHPEDHERDARDIQQLMQKHRVMSEVRIIRKDGVIRWVQVYAHPLWDEAADELVGIYGAVQDVTERKQIEETLERERTLLRTVIDNLPDYIYLKDTEHRCLVSNLANARTLGVSGPEEVEGKTLFDFYPPEEAERFNALDKRIISTGEAILRQEGSFIDAETGQKRWTWMTRTLLRAKNGRIMGVVGISRDITAYKEAEMEREQLINDLKAKNRELEQFTYTVSHDLKSPLVTVTGFLGYLKKDMVTGNTERMKKDIGLIQEAVKKMKRLLDDLLELSRVGRVMNPPVQIPFNSIVQEALTLVEGRISDRRVQIEVAENLPIVYGDRGRLVELVQNLVDNAVKFMGDQPQPRIEIGSQGQSEQGNPIFFIKDNGIGIAPPYHENIFGLFNKLDPQVDGTGIGLALVKQIIEVHNGRIWIESEGNHKGSTFYFHLGHLPEQPPKQ